MVWGGNPNIVRETILVSVTVLLQSARPFPMRVRLPGAGTVGSPPAVPATRLK
ncbi:MAG: hypothetical protein JWL84_5487 [Rhodospirillales bacterium]|nr:hypothetical protein [Rhodospirillales bacterium]